MPRNPTTQRAQRIRDGFIYFILQGKDSWEHLTRAEFENMVWDGVSFVKVGRAVDVRKRLESLQCGNQMGLQLLGCGKGGPELEGKLHRWLRPYRHSCGEWFQYSYRVAQYINGLHLYKLDGNCEPHNFPDLHLSEMLLGCECVWVIEDLLKISEKHEEENKSQRSIQHWPTSTPPIEGQGIVQQKGHETSERRNSRDNV